MHHTFPEGSPHWVTFRQPHSLFWLDFPASTMFLAIYSGYTLFLVITCGLLVMRRNHYMFRKNPVGAAVIAASMQWLIGSIHLYRFISSRSLPIWLMILRNYVMFPLCLIFGIQARGMRILFDAIWTWSIGRPIPAPPLIVERMERPKVTNSNGGLRLAISHSAHSALFMAKGKDTSVVAHLTVWQRLKVRMQSAHLHVWLKNHGTYLILLGLSGVHLLTATILLILNWDKQLPYHTREIFGLEDFGVAVSVILYIVIWSPLMLYYLSGVKDAYGLRRDLKVGVCYALPCYILYACFRYYDFLQHIRMELPSFIFMLLSMASVHGASVVAPLARTMFWAPEELDVPPLEGGEEQTVERHSPYEVVVRVAVPQEGLAAIIIPHRPIPLERVLEHPHLAGPFEAYSKTAFVWDSVLFYRAITEYRERVRTLPGCAPLAAHAIYERYIKAGSPCEMNLSYPVIQRINAAMAQGTFETDLYDEAQAEIIRLVGNCTYRNFLYTLDPIVKRRYMIPYARTAPHPG